MKTFLISVVSHESFVTLKIGFNPVAPASNDQIIKDAVEAAKEVKGEVSGKLLKLDGPASLPVAIALSHEFAHIVPAIACWDPKLSKFVVSVSHDVRWSIGDLID